MQTAMRTLFSPTTARRSRLSSFSKTILTLCVLLLAPGSANAQYNPRITQVDASAFPTVRVYVSTTDSDGNPIPDNLQAQLTLYEDGKPVSQDVLSQGWTVSTVLVLDLSTSMNKDSKIQRAKEAAINYLNTAPPYYHVAVVGFSNTAAVIGDFSDDRNALRNRIASLPARGRTALQDGIAVALNLLRNRRDRRAVTVLTDGWENNSRLAGEAGHNELLQRARKESSSVSIIGLGGDVDTNYLKSYQKTGGWYLFTPSANDLRSIFEKAVTLLEKEKVLTFVSAKPDADGSVKMLSLELKVGDQMSSDRQQYISPGVIPHVRGDHLPYFVIVLGLLLAPSVFSVVGNLVSVYRFRSANLVRLQRGSSYIGRRDPNIGSTGRGFEEGDLVIICPHSKTPHHVRSWRNHRCHCMREPMGRGSFCYQRRFPKFVRAVLDRLSHKHVGETGRTWLCWCAGDKDGW